MNDDENDQVDEIFVGCNLRYTESILNNLDRDWNKITNIVIGYSSLVAHRDVHVSKLTFVP